MSLAQEGPQGKMSLQTDSNTKQIGSNPPLIEILEFLEILDQKWIMEREGEKYFAAHYL